MTNLPNRPSLEDLTRIPPRDIAALPATLLAELQGESDAALAAARAAKARLETALELRYGDQATAARCAEGKDTGTVRLTDGAVTIVAELPKKVDWDQAALAGMVARIRAAGEDPAEYIDISYKVAERKYAAWPEAIRRGFAAARTVRPGAPRIELLRQGEA